MRILPEPCALLCAEDLLRLRSGELAARLAPHITISMQRSDPPAPERLARNLARDILSARPEAFLFADPAHGLRMTPAASGALGEAFHTAFESCGHIVEGAKIQFVLAHPAIYACALEACPALCAQLDELANVNLPYTSKDAICRARTHEHLETLREQTLSETETKALNLFMLEGTFCTSSIPTGKFAAACDTILSIALREDEAGKHARSWLSGLSKQPWGAPCVHVFLRTAMAALEARDLAGDLQQITETPQGATKKPAL